MRSQRVAQRLFFRMIEGGAQHRPPDALQRRQHFVGSHLRISRNKAALPD